MTFDPKGLNLQLSYDNLSYHNSKFLTTSFFLDVKGRTNNLFTETVKPSSEIY